MAPPQETRSARENLKACFAEEREVVFCKKAEEEVLTPAHRAVVLGLLSERLTGLERWEEAQEADKELSKLRPEDAGPRLRLGERLLYIFGRQDEALQAFREASTLNRDDPRAPALQGIALNVLGRFEESRAAFEESLRRDPGFLDTHPAAHLVKEASDRSEKWPGRAASDPKATP